VSTSRTFFILASCEKVAWANPTTAERIRELSFPEVRWANRVGPGPFGPGRWDRTRPGGSPGLRQGAVFGRLLDFLAHSADSW
jgi:hypothetical protein